MKIIYLEAGSGADQAVPAATIAAVKSAVEVPLFAGGGITTPELLNTCYIAGADVAVIGNALEHDPALLKTFTSIRDRFNP
jgi:putative glycerol-1-phosphate prenyltransferase